MVSEPGREHVVDQHAQPHALRTQPGIKARRAGEEPMGTERQEGGTVAGGDAQGSGAQALDQGPGQRHIAPGAGAIGQQGLHIRGLRGEERAMGQGGKDGDTIRPMRPRPALTHWGEDAQLHPLDARDIPGLMQELQQVLDIEQDGGGVGRGRRALGGDLQDAGFLGNAEAVLHRGGAQQGLIRPVATAGHAQPARGGE